MSAQTGKNEELDMNEILDKKEKIGKVVEMPVTTSVCRDKPCENEDFMQGDLSLGKFFGDSEVMPRTVLEKEGGSAMSKGITEESIVIDRVTAATIKVPLVIGGIHSKAVIDTGAEVTVMSEALYTMIPENRRPELKKATRNLVVAEAGKQMSTRGITELT